MPQPSPQKFSPPELDQLSSMINQEGDVWTAEFQGLTLKTALQPIYSVSHKRIVGYEALIRAFDTRNTQILPVDLFKLPASDFEDLLLDRLCRYLHIRNYSGIKDDLNWLFLNVSPKVATVGNQSDSFFGQLLKKTGLPPHRIVMEIVEQPTDDAERLREAVAYYRELGCLTAIDDFGAGHSNFERIWNLSPDIVKLDRTLLTRATEDPKARQILNGIVSLLHQSACLVLLEGVETRSQAMIAIDAGVDFVQGFYFRKPSTQLSGLDASPADFGQLLDEYKQHNPVTFDPTQQIGDGLGISGKDQPVAAAQVLFGGYRRHHAAIPFDFHQVKALKLPESGLAHGLAHQRPTVGNRHFQGELPHGTEFLLIFPVR